MPNPNFFGLDAPIVWDTHSAYQHLHALEQADTKRTAERRLHELGLLPAELTCKTWRMSWGARPPSRS